MVLGAVLVYYSMWTNRFNRYPLSEHNLHVTGTLFIHAGPKPFQWWMVLLNMDKVLNNNVSECTSIPSLQTALNVTKSVFLVLISHYGHIRHTARAVSAEALP